VIFCGVMNYAPNEEGALWLSKEVWPRLRARRSDARLLLVGSAPTQAIRNLASDSSIEVTGHVADVRPYLWRAAVAVAPVRVARGVQNKVLEAAAAGLPIVITSAVAAGLPSEVLPACTVADEPDAFAAAINGLLNRSPAERRAIAQRANLESLTWEKRLGRLPDLLAEAASKGAETRRRLSGT
jgi:glycosyltransferase involved in cell wall biosynthesis